MTLENNRAPLLYYIKLCVSFQIRQWIQTGVTVQKRSTRVKISNFFVPSDLEIQWMTSTNNRAPLLYYIKLCASFQTHGCIQTVWKRPIWVKIGDFLSHLTLKFDEWHWKTIGHLFYVTSSCVHHIIAIGQFKLELQSRNLGENRHFFAQCDLKFDGWSWKTIGHLFYASLGFVRHIMAIGLFKLELQSGDAKFGWKLAIFCPVWPWNLTEDLEKQ